MIPTKEFDLQSELGIPKTDWGSVQAVKERPVAHYDHYPDHRIDSPITPESCCDGGCQRPISQREEDEDADGNVYVPLTAQEVDEVLQEIRSGETYPTPGSPAHDYFTPCVEINAPPDLINHPPHYAKCSPEPIEIIESWGLGYHEGNAVKYIARARYKGMQVKDLRKAAWYLTRRADELEKESAK